MKTSLGNNNTWLFLLISGIALVALSIAAFVNAEQALGLLVYAVGIALCAVSVALGVAALLPGRKDERLRLLMLAAGNALLGIFVMIFSQLALIFVGVALALNGLGAVQNAAHRKKENEKESGESSEKKDGEKSWIAEMFLGITFFALGAVVVVFHDAIRSLIGSAFGLLLLIAGLSLGIIALLMPRKIRS
jgi:uncharacterized membrane protein HdeD (DUF308 family)